MNFSKGIMALKGKLLHLAVALQEGFVKKCFRFTLPILFLTLCPVAQCDAQGKNVQMKIAGYLCGN